MNFFSCFFCSFRVFLTILHQINYLTIWHHWRVSKNYGMDGVDQIESASVCCRFINLIRNLCLSLYTNPTSPILMVWEGFFCVHWIILCMDIVTGFEGVWCSKIGWCDWYYSHQIFVFMTFFWLRSSRLSEISA